MHKQAMASLKHISITMAPVTRTTANLALQSTVLSHLNKNFTVAGSTEVKRLNEGQWNQALKSIENNTFQNLDNACVSTWTFRT